MNRQEHSERLQAIGTCEDEAERRELIAQLIDDAGADYDNHASVTAERDQLLQDNENLRAANMKLFLRVGDHDEPEDKPGDKPKEKLKFENLFDEKGGLK